MCFFVDGRSKENPSSSSQLDASEPLQASSWTDGEMHIRVTNPEGFSVKVEAHARIDLPRDEVYSILTEPDNHEVFSSIDAIPYRKILRRNLLLGTQTVSVDHSGRWRLGPFGGKILTRLLVDEDSRARTVRFTLREEEGGGEKEAKKAGKKKKKKKKNKEEKEESDGSAAGRHHHNEHEHEHEHDHHRRRLASGSFMSRFEGGWRVAPMSQSALDAALRIRRSPIERMMLSLPSFATSGGSGGSGGGRGGRGGDGDGGGDLSSTSSLVSLDHALAPAFALPPPFDRIIVSIAARQVRTLLEDLRDEAARRKGKVGASSPKSSSSTSSRGNEETTLTRRRRPPPFPPLLW